MQAGVASDLIWGVEEIAEAIGREERATYHLLSKGQLPARKVGGRWVASRDRLMKFFAPNDGDEAA